MQCHPGTVHASSKAWYTGVFRSTEPATRLGGYQGTRTPVLKEPSSLRPQGPRCPEVEPATRFWSRAFLMCVRNHRVARQVAAVRSEPGRSTTVAFIRCWVVRIRKHDPTGFPIGPPRSRGHFQSPSSMSRVARNRSRPDPSLSPLGDAGETSTRPRDGHEPTGSDRRQRSPSARPLTSSAVSPNVGCDAHKSS